MTSKIKVDNINKVSDDSNIINKCGTTITLGATGDSINLASGASQTGFGRTGTVDWITTPKTTGTFTAVSGEGYFLNTSGGVITANLPAGVAGAIVSFADYAATWQTSNVTVTPNGTDKIGSLNENAVLNTEGQSVTFVYVDSTQGWINTMDSTSNVRGNPFMVASISGACNTLTTCGNYKIATFLGPGTFTVNAAATCAANNVVDYLVAAGGGSGGYCNYAGGGGGGGFRYYANTIVNPQSGPGAPINNYPSGTAITVTATAFPITVGGGGTRPGPGVGVNGSNSIFSSITSAGGGGGAGDTCSALTGGSGGGGAGGTPASKAGGAGNTPPTSPSQGTPGYGPTAAVGVQGSGGGGAIVGGPGSNLEGGNGAGVTGFGISGESSGGQYYFSGGGGAFKTPGAGGLGGLGGGGDGASNPNEGPGTANTGGGGGSASPGNGGSGIVIIRYKFQ